MNRSQLRFVILVASHCALLTAQSPTGIPPMDLFPASGTARVSFRSGEPAGVWSGGALVTVEHAKSALPVFHTVSRSGGGTATVPLSIPGARLVNVYSGRFARGYDGTLAVAGSAYTDDSRSAIFLALIPPHGQGQTLVQLSPFVPSAITVASDGSTWAAGRELTAGKETNPNHHIIRRFDAKGKMAASFISRASVSIKAGYTHPTDYSYLVSSKDRVGWYSEAAGAYIDFSLNGAVMNRYNTPSTLGMPGLALCDDGSVFVSTRSAGSSGTGWGIHILLRQRSQWLFVPRTEKWGMLLGCDGTRLAATTDLSTVVWLEPNTAGLAALASARSR